MQPVQELLNRIRWDKKFGAADFEVGYYDRVEDCIIQIPFAALHFPDDDHQVFELLDTAGVVRRIPYHRVREVLRNGCCIWSRHPY